MAAIESNRDEVHLVLTRVEAAALQVVGDTGLKVTEALGLVQNTGAAERALNQLRAAIRLAETVKPAKAKR